MLFLNTQYMHYTPATQLNHINHSRKYEIWQRNQRIVEVHVTGMEGIHQTQRTFAVSAQFDTTYQSTVE